MIVREIVWGVSSGGPDEAPAPFRRPVPVTTCIYGGIGERDGHGAGRLCIRPTPLVAIFARGRAPAFVVVQLTNPPLAS